MSEESPDTLRRLGVKVEGLERIKLGRGVIGKASYVAAATVIALGGVAWALRDSTFLLIDACLIAAVFIFYLAGALWFSHTHPGAALLEGAELIQWRQLDIAASHAPPVLDTTKTSPPNLIETQ